jgi:hypothetical protein
MRTSSKAVRLRQIKPPALADTASVFIHQSVAYNYARQSQKAGSFATARLKMEQA